MTLKPWRDLIVPHSNVLEGTFQEAEFAADLSKVVAGTAPAEYQDPTTFFERTYITEGMELLLTSVARRLSGRGGDPVVQLQTAFGGGKTHAMLAVYHMALGEKPVKSMPGVSALLDKAGISDLTRGRVAVLDGNNLSASQPRKRGAVTINTLWGEIAWQLGGEEGFRLLEQSDRDGTSPGKEILATIFEKFAPCIVLMDETVAYVRQFERGKSYAGGTFESNMSFLQALTEAAGHVKSAMVLASLPESDLEVGGERGKEALKKIEHLFHRVEAIWKPVAPEEGFEIVRRRLFTELKDEKARDVVCRAFAELYIEEQSYPSEAREGRYLDRLKKAYPIHPEVFDRLYEDWATLENFQRTRGVLRLMAMIVHHLWKGENADYMIMPGSLPLYESDVRNELIRYLPQGWEPVLDRDVDGPRARPTALDTENPLLGSVQAARRVARTIFLGSAPSSSGQRIRGIGAEHIRLGCCQPEQQVGRFNDALRYLTDQLHFLYSGKDQYWYDTQTNLRREAEDRMSRFNRSEDLVPEIGKRLRSGLRGRTFDGIHVFTAHGDVPDDTQVRLVVLSPTVTHGWHQEGSAATKAAMEVVKNRGQQPRLNQNRLIFLAADADAVSPLYDQAKRFLAWQSIVNEKEALNLDQHRIREATQNRNESEDRLKGSIAETFKWVLAPAQDADKKGGISDIRWEEQRVNAVNGDKVAAILRILEEQELLIPRWSPYHLKTVLDTWYWKDGRVDYSLETLWNDFCRYPYLPRLTSREVLQQTVEEGVSGNDFFGYAAGKEHDRYSGLKFGEKAPIYIDESSVIVGKDIAAVASAVPPAAPTDQPEGTPTPPPMHEEGPVKKDATQTTHKIRRFHGSVTLSPSHAALDFSKISEEVIQHLASDIDTQVTITVEIEAISPKGFSEHTRRTVSENGMALSFDHGEFEEE